MEAGINNALFVPPCTGISHMFRVGAKVPFEFITKFG
jgi:hypothetical protein